MLMSEATGAPQSDNSNMFAIVPTKLIQPVVIVKIYRVRRIRRRPKRGPCRKQASAKEQSRQ